MSLLLIINSSDLEKIPRKWEITNDVCFFKPRHFDLEKIPRKREITNFVNIGFRFFRLGEDPKKVGNNCSIVSFCNSIVNWRRSRESGK